MLTMKQKQAVTRQVALRYKRARKKEKGISEFIKNYKARP